MLLDENEVLDSITVEGTLNASKDAFEKTVQKYVRDRNKERREENKKERKQIMVEFGNLILFFSLYLLNINSYFIKI